MYWNMVGMFPKVSSQSNVRVVFSTVQSCINCSDSIHLHFFIMNSRLISTDFSGLKFKFDVVNELKCTEPHRGMAGQKDCGWHKMSGYILLTLQ